MTKRTPTTTSTPSDVPPITLRVSSTDMIHAPGMFLFLVNAFRTEPRAWSLKALNAFTCDRLNNAQATACIAGNFAIAEEPGKVANCPTLILTIPKPAQR